MILEITPLQPSLPAAQPAAKPKAAAPRTPRRAKETGIPWLDEPFSHVKGEQALWVAVITQAMMDALSKSRNPELIYHRDDAIRWLTGNSKDFHEVCHHAGMDPDYVRRKAKKALAAPVAWRAEPGKGKRYAERKQRDERRRQAIHLPATPSSESNVITGPWS
jgi:hypothetical protein